MTPQTPSVFSNRTTQLLRSTPAATTSTETQKPSSKRSNCKEHSERNWNNQFRVKENGNSISKPRGNRCNHSFYTPKIIANEVFGEWYNEFGEWYNE